MSINVGLKPNFELRAIAREKLKGKWLYAILVSVVAGIISGIAGVIPIVGAIIGIILSGPISLGLAKFFLKLRRDENPIIEDLFDGFKQFTPALVLELWMILFTFLWTLLLIIPGIIASFRYALSFYILHDNPEMKPRDVIKLSKQMMLGRKGKLFMLGLSFIGWFLLCIPTLFIGLFWLIPYVSASMVCFYEDLKTAPMAANAPNATTTV